jgi:hypothetical protein
MKVVPSHKAVLIQYLQVRLAYFFEPHVECLHVEPPGLGGSVHSPLRTSLSPAGVHTASGAGHLNTTIGGSISQDPLKVYMQLLFSSKLLLLYKLGQFVNSNNK